MTLTRELIYVSASVVCAGIAGVYDVRFRRIPNRLTGAAILLGLLLHLFLEGPAQLGLAALSGLLAGGIFLIFYIAGGMGAGDVKLMAAVGCIVGMTAVKEVLISTVIIGGVFAVLMAIYRGQFWQTLWNVKSLLDHHRAHGLSSHPELNLSNSKTLRLPYALPIAAGCLVTLYVISFESLVR